MTDPKVKSYVTYAVVLAVSLSLAMSSLIGLAVLLGERELVAVMLFSVVLVSIAGTLWSNMRLRRSELRVFGENTDNL